MRRICTRMVCSTWKSVSLFATQYKGTPATSIFSRQRGTRDTLVSLTELRCWSAAALRRRAKTKPNKTCREASISSCWSAVAVFIDWRLTSSTIFAEKLVVSFLLRLRLVNPWSPSITTLFRVEKKQPRSRNPARPSRYRKARYYY